MQVNLKESIRHTLQKHWHKIHLLYYFTPIACKNIFIHSFIKHSLSFNNIKRRPQYKLQSLQKTEVYLVFSRSFVIIFASKVCDYWLRLGRWKEIFTLSVAKLSHSPTPIVLSPTEKNGRVGQDIWKGVYYALVLTFWNPRKISKCKSKTKQRGCPVGVLYTYPKYRTAIGVSIPYGNYWYRGSVIHIGVGFGVARFDLQGHS